MNYHAFVIASVARQSLWVGAKLYEIAALRSQ